MNRITDTSNSQPQRWTPNPGEVAAIVAALRNEAYPPTARWGVGPATRKTI